MRKNWILSLVIGCVFFSLVLMIINNLLSDRMVSMLHCNYFVNALIEYISNSIYVFNNNANCVILNVQEHT